VTVMRLAHLPAIALVVIACASVSAQAGAANRADPGDLALARRVVPRVADFPTGWSGKPDSAKDSGCFTGPLKARTPTALVESQRLTSGNQDEESSAVVVVYASSAIARRALAAATIPATFACYRRQLPSQLEQNGISLASYVGGRVSVGGLGDSVVANRFVVGLKKGQATGTLYTDYVFVQRRRVVIAGFFADESAKPSLSDERAVLAKAVARVR
jgi:hypothetical protein